MECGQVEGLLKLTDDDKAIMTTLEAVAAMSKHCALVPIPRVHTIDDVANSDKDELNSMFLYSIVVFRFGSLEALTNPPVGFEFGWAAFLLFYSVTSVALHSITLYSVVAAAYIRYSSTRTLSNKWRHHNVSRTLTTTCVAVTVLCIPTICLHSVKHVFPPSGHMRALYRINLSGFGPLPACTLFKINLWLSGIFFKVCALIACSARKCRECALT
ncbi:Protein DMSR-6 [Aphelenchoides avenae]|nr:Protein DMSR-6 [Aphelenchus avenae]